MLRSSRRYCRSLIFCLAITVSLFAGEQYGDLPHVASLGDSREIFFSTPEEIYAFGDQACASLQRQIDTLLAVQEKTFANTFQAYDALAAYADYVDNRLLVVEYISSDEKLKEAAHVVQEMVSDLMLAQTPVLYQVLNSSSFENLSKEEFYFLNNTLFHFETHEFTQLPKEIGLLKSLYIQALILDESYIEASKEDLKGLDEEFIRSLPKNERGNFRVDATYSTYFQVMDHCQVSSTRKRFWTAFNNRAASENIPILAELLQKRQEWACLLGYKSYADWDLSDQMAQSPERVFAFLDALNGQSTPHEFLGNQKIQPWDISYLLTNHEKETFALDRRQVAEYFPIEKTLEGMLKVYEQFFNLTFVRHPDVIEVLQNQKVMGYLFLDLFPRKNKYSHACHIGILPAITEKNGDSHPAVALLVANFPPLLEPSDVKTLFHEFGHALHDFLGSTQFATLSGTQVKRDFVEMPSQMLEYWLTDPEILKMISSHYQTGQPLPDEMIQSLALLRKMNQRLNLQQQLFYAYFALQVHTSDDNLDFLTQKLSEKTCPWLLYSPENHFYAAFSHLIDYDSKYYGYLWSKVLAFDLFNHIKQYGLLNPAIGQAYVDEVLSKGGTVDPNELLFNFLGRQPNTEAFINSLKN